MFLHRELSIPGLSISKYQNIDNIPINTRDFPVGVLVPGFSSHQLKMAAITNKTSQIKIPPLTILIDRAQQ